MEVITATFDTQTTEGLTKVFNATNGASTPLRNAVGEIIEIEDILIYSDTVTSFGAQPTEAELVAFFTTDGKTYAGVSSVATKSAKNLVDMMKANNEISPKITFVKGKSTGGQEFVNLNLISL